jgi:hypothetical protein
MPTVLCKQKHADLLWASLIANAKQKRKSESSRHTATIEMHNVAQKRTQALLGIGNAACALTPNVHSLAKELPAASGSHWLNTPNTDEPVSKITLKGCGGDPMDTLLKYLAACYDGY